MRMRKVIALFVTFAMVFGSLSMAFAATDDESAVAETTSVKATFSDVAGHWGEGSINKWSGYGIISGYEGAFRPDAPITRAEMAVVLDKMMHYQTAAKNTFSDVPQDAWFANAILKANAAGILNGDGAGHATPNANITREQAASMLARAFAVESNNGGQTSFKDAAKISSWAKETVYGMEAAKYITGADGNFNPQNPITRAEVVTIMNNAVKAYYNAAGTYSDTVDGLAVVAVKDVVLKNAVINGNLILAEGIAKDDVTLEGTTVKGDVIVRGGGTNSVKITGNSQISGTVKVQKIGDSVRIFTADGTVISKLEASASVVLEGSFKNVEVTSDVKVEVKGTVESLKVEKSAEGASVTVASGAKVTTLQVEAPKTSLAVNGTVSTVQVAKSADGTKLAIDKNATVDKLDNSAKIETSGEGKAKTTTGEGTVTTPGTTTPSTPSNGGGSGGGGGGGSSSPAVPTLKSIVVTADGTELSGDGKTEATAYVIPAGVEPEKAEIVMTLGNIEDGRNYTASVEVKNEADSVRATASATTKGVYINDLLNGRKLRLSDLEKALKRLSNEKDYKDYTENTLVDYFEKMVPGVIYEMTVTITPEGYANKAVPKTIYLKLAK